MSLFGQPPRIPRTHKELQGNKDLLEGQQIHQMIKFSPGVKVRKTDAGMFPNTSEERANSHSDALPQHQAESHGLDLAHSWCYTPTSSLFQCIQFLLTWFQPFKSRLACSQQRIITSIVYFATFLSWDYIYATKFMMLQRLFLKGSIWPCSFYCPDYSSPWLGLPSWSAPYTQQWEVMKRENQGLWRAQSNSLPIV